jgi:hypothetical protein
MWKDSIENFDNVSPKAIVDMVSTPESLKQHALIFFVMIHLAVLKLSGLAIARIQLID